MRKRVIFTLVLLLGILFCGKNVYAFDTWTYRDHNICGNFELAGFREDGSLAQVGCYNTYEEARDAMKTYGGNDLGILAWVDDIPKIIDANVALLDLSVNPETLTYFYRDSDLTQSFTYMDTGSLYGGVDGIHLETAYSTKHGWVSKVMIGNCIAWIKNSAYEIVPITWIQSTSTYTVTNTDIRHNYVAKIQNTYNGSSGRNIGPKPDMLNPGTYYSYDGHYFYTDLLVHIKDAKAGSHENSVNKDNPYYNYYMYLSNHTKTNYSNVNINEYVKNNLGFSFDAYGKVAETGASRLHASGDYFTYAQEKYGVNAILALSLSRNETGNGRSKLAVQKNNGFGLNAVDSNPIGGADWYPSFANSILGYASKWITYGYNHPRDWRYFGPQFGDKGIGMNVKYASDTYWSEKMAANYYSFDKAFGMQDYNYYQLGVVTEPTIAYAYPDTNSYRMYTYPEKEDAVVIIGEVDANGEKWYQVMSDLNYDGYFQEKTWGDYNWNATVYVKASTVQKINTGKNGYIHPNEVFEYPNKNYHYDLLTVDGELRPQVGISKKVTPYYFDSTLVSKGADSLQKDRYVMIYAVAFENNIPVSYLVTSSYAFDQKAWVEASAIELTNTNYGLVTITLEGNPYSWVNYNTDDASYSYISSLYHNTYVPILDTINNNGTIWYKVPVSLINNNNIYGYTLASAYGVSIKTATPTTISYKPTITAEDKVITEGETFNPKAGVTASDPEDGDLTSKIEVIENTVNTSVPGEYKVTYKVQDSSSLEETKTIKVTVKANSAPTINASNKTIYVGDAFNPKDGVTANDPEDGDLTKNIQVKENTVNTAKAGTYKVIYEVSDSKGKKTTKEISVTVKEKVVDPTPPEENIDELIEGSLEGEFYLDGISWNKDSKKFTIQGYSILLNHSNSTSKEYKILFVDRNTKKTYSSVITSWTQNVPYDLGSENGFSYSNSWFKGTIDFTKVPNGDYDIYMVTSENGDYTVEQVNNFLNRKITRRGEDSNHGYNFKVQQRTRIKELQISIRDHVITTAEAPTNRNMVNGYDEIKFNGNNLYILGYSYDYQGVYDNPTAITRKIIFENNISYQQVVEEVGSTKGPFELTTLDQKDKTYAWYEASINISNLPKGEYTLFAYTKTGNAENFDEIPDMLKTLNKTATINGKKFTIYCNRKRNNRIELKVE